MGVKDLWSILSPVCERKSLFELQDKTIAIDLSCWVCESQNLSEQTTQARMYLRNLFFRTSCLVLLGVQPVFVLEGVAPALKHNTIAHRNEQQTKRKNPTNASQTQQKRPGNRSRLQSLLKQCKDLLDIMGLPCIQGPGEAEAFCALLDQQGLVDGCITQDGDCFLYGAQTVYRNFTISPHGTGGSRGFSVDVYKMSAIEEKLFLGRDKLIAISMLCGCDYNDRGVAGVGKESVMKFIITWKDEDVLKRLKDWRTNSYYDELEHERTAVVKGIICERCGHTGRRLKHDRSGCEDCGLHKGCVKDGTRQHLTDPSVLAELSVRKKALMDPKFPSEEMLQEFLQKGYSMQPCHVNKCWKQPDLITFIKYSVKLLMWTEMYALEKFLPLVTRWQLLSIKKQIQKRTEISKSVFIFTPQIITKKRIVKGVQSYEIQWSDDKDLLKEITFEDNVSLKSLLVTVEPQTLVENACPDLVNTFIAEKEAKSKKGKKKIKSKVDRGGINKENDGCSPQLDAFLNKQKSLNAPNNIESVFSKLSLESKDKPHNDCLARTQKLRESKAERLSSKQAQKMGTQPKILNFLTMSRSKPLEEFNNVEGIQNSKIAATSSCDQLQSRGRGSCRSSILEKGESYNSVKGADISIGNISCDDCELCNSSTAENDSIMDLSAIIEGIVGTVSDKYIDTDRKIHETNDAKFKAQNDTCILTMSQRNCNMVESTSSLKNDTLNEGKTSSQQAQSLEKENIIKDEFDTLSDATYVPLFLRI